MSVNIRKLFRRLTKILAGFVILYILSLVFLYFKQEKFFFNPKVLAEDYVFEFDRSFEELYIPVGTNDTLHAVLFKTPESKGVVLYFHGNAGAIHNWGKRAHLFLDNGYDALFVDYRGYGKSKGLYTNGEALLDDANAVYQYTKTLYDEDQIVVLGFSLGSGLASYVASKNNPKFLILNAPYYSWKTLIAEEIAPPIPKFIINYDIPTYRYIPKIKCPIHIFHGTKDFLIHPNTNSKLLQALNPKSITLTLIENAGHNGIHITKTYYDKLKTLLSEL
ncbi:MAG: alpha/beta fold hydrolase [Flavobacteriaceae bacterium]|nr:alpha/beta fold hydrolase [Flavobacteriaceae bacterium]